MATPQRTYERQIYELRRILSKREKLTPAQIMIAEKHLAEAQRLAKKNPTKK